MNNIKRTERGWAGHFICSSRCRFRRNTLLELGGRRVVVSTVGSYFPTADDREPATIGVSRYYETMAFEAIYLEPYWEANVTEEITFNSAWQMDYITHESDIDANNMHEAVVKELSEKMVTEFVDKLVNESYDSKNL